VGPDALVDVFVIVVVVIVVFVARGCERGRQNPPAQLKRARAAHTQHTRATHTQHTRNTHARCRTALPPRRTASKTLPKKFIALTLLLRRTAHPRKSRSNARPRARAGCRCRNDKGNPKRFPAQPTKAFSLSLSPNQKCFQPETFLPTRRSFAPPAKSLNRFSSSSSSYITPTLSALPARLSVCLPPPQSLNE
jgi:hypothetical protein